jgi:two-component system, OmpR family, sensor histidine kinase PhoQ
MVSIRARLLLAGSAVLLVFLTLCGVGLETAFRDAARDAQEGRMRGLVYALLGAAEPGPGDALELPERDLPEPRLRQPQSGLEAAILDEAGTVLWRSPSASGPLPVVIGPRVGDWRFERLEGDGRFALAFGLRWVGADARTLRYSVLVLEDDETYAGQLSVFRRTLWAWLLASAAGLLAALLAVQRWGLTPLRRLVGELHGVERGTRAQIESAYPAELTPLTGALNALIRSERGQLGRYRNALGDLAHSFKTPLAVLRGLAGDPRLPEEARRQLDDQLSRMQQIADHQLARAATAGRRALAQPLALRPIAAKIAGALRKVYADRGLALDVEVPEGLLARVESGDLHELLGNTFDNACKWARTRARLGALREGTTLVLRVDDDGPGFPADAERLLGRGVRADSRMPGQGLGLAAVAEIVGAYEGRIELERSPDLGGARVTLRIPDA